MLRSGDNIGQTNGKSTRDPIRSRRRDCFALVGQKWQKYVVQDLLLHVTLMEIDVIVAGSWDKLLEIRSGRGLTLTR
jgi:hypothetical protein